MRLIGDIVGLIVAGAESRLTIVDGLLVAMRQDGEKHVSDQDAGGDEIDEGPVHAAALSDRLHGSTASSISICASERPSSSECRQPVTRMMWIARGREGGRLPLTISEA